MSLNSQPPSSVEEMTPSTTGSHGGCLNLIVLVLTWLWIAVIIIGGTLALLAISSFSLLFPGWYYVTLQIGMGVLLLIPLLLLAILVRAHEYRAVFRTWLLARINTNLRHNYICSRGFILQIRSNQTRQNQYPDTD